MGSGSYLGGGGGRRRGRPSSGGRKGRGGCCREMPTSFLEDPYIILSCHYCWVCWLGGLTKCIIASGPLELGSILYPVSSPEETYSCSHIH